MNKDLIVVKRALISVHDKIGVDELARKLVKKKIEIVSTGGTAEFLKQKSIPVTDVSAITNFPELMDGRLKTLHPKIHGGLLAVRENRQHLSSMKEYNIPKIDLLIVNLYPFETMVNEGASISEIIENIDIGGPAMIRAGAKNHKYVSVLVDQQDYGILFDELEGNAGCTSGKFRRSLAEIAFARTAEYDGAISRWMNQKFNNKEPRRLIISGISKKKLRYGENPHQLGAYYQTNLTNDILSSAEILQGKELSFNNISDINAALEVLREFDKEARSLAVIVKHTNTCGVALKDNIFDAYMAAFDCDKKSAFGGVIAFNNNIDGKTAKEICKSFTEIVVAPSVDPDALVEFSKKKNLRLMVLKKKFLSQNTEVNFKQVTGGILVQEKDVRQVSLEDISVVSSKVPSKSEVADMLFAWKVSKHLKSNAIVLAKNHATIGIGAGQMSRLDSTKIAKSKIEYMLKEKKIEKYAVPGAVAASDAFFPFADSIIELAKAGITAVIQPGGSLKDSEVIEAANRANMSMIFTHIRHFKH
tara:strand:+ start:2029 stop:3621 length:1593 start_codon:yes stop_codon:yes gene_type:complete